MGDSHDFLKYALLRHLSQTTEFRVGLNWYLTRPEDVDPINNNDGEKRFHIKDRAWRAWDDELFDCIQVFAAPDRRVLSCFHGTNILPTSTVFYEDYVSTTDRSSWHQKGCEALKDADLIFLDPDNGFEVASASGPRRAKYVFYSEFADYYSKGKAVISIQFARQCDPTKRAIEVRQSALKSIGGGELIPVMRGRVAPNILFISAAPEGKASKLSKALRSFALSAPPMGASGNRVEVIE